MFEDLLASLELLSASDVRQASLDEINDVCKNPVFQLLCDLCEVLHPRKASKVK